MNEFDHFLEMQLRHMLDPVVATPAPSRRLRRTSGRELILTVEVPAQPSDAIPVAEHVVVAFPAAAAQH